MEVVPNHMTLDSPDAPWNEPVGWEDEEPEQTGFEFFDGSKIYLEEFGPRIIIPKDKPWMIYSTAAMVAEKMAEKEMSNEDAEILIRNLYQFKRECY